MQANYDGILYPIYTVGLTTGIFLLPIFMGVGAMPDFGPLLANPRTLLLGAAAQFGIFAALLGALVLNWVGLDFSLQDAAAIGIIGGADGPTSIYVTTKLAPELLGPLRWPPIPARPWYQSFSRRSFALSPMRTSARSRWNSCARSGGENPVLGPAADPGGTGAADAAPLLGMFCFGNLMKESGGSAAWWTPPAGR